MEHLQSLENELFSKSSNETPTVSSFLPSLEFHFLTLFPEIFSEILNASLLGKAQKKGLVAYHLSQIRDFAKDKHRTVDDTPYGGGEGMLLKPDVLFDAWEAAHKTEPQKKTVTILLSPQGTLLTQKLAHELLGYSRLILVCGHYEGVDERFIEQCIDYEVSIGDYVLTGGELPALVVADTVTRLIPGVVGNHRSLSQESLENGLLKYPQYTKPREFKGKKVPPILLEGDHGAIQKWREQQSQERTQKKRPDLWQKYLQSGAK